jgi:hypothetical protein
MQVCGSLPEDLQFFLQDLQFFLQSANFCIGLGEFIPKKLVFSLTSRK